MTSRGFRSHAYIVFVAVLSLVARGQAQFDNQTAGLLLPSGTVSNPTWAVPFFVANADGGVSWASLVLSNTSRVVSILPNTLNFNIVNDTTSVLVPSVTRSSCASLALQSPSQDTYAYMTNATLYSPPRSFVDSSGNTVPYSSLLRANRTYINSNAVVANGDTALFPVNNLANNTLVFGNGNASPQPVNISVSFRPAGGACSTSSGSASAGRQNPVVMISQGYGPPSPQFDLMTISFGNATCAKILMTATANGPDSGLANATLSNNIIGSATIGSQARFRNIDGAPSLTVGPGISGSTGGILNSLSPTDIHVINATLSTNGTTRNNVTVSLRVAVLSGANANCSSDIPDSLLSDIGTTNSSGTGSASSSSSSSGTGTGTSSGSGSSGSGSSGSSSTGSGTSGSGSGSGGSSGTGSGSGTGVSSGGSSGVGSGSGTGTGGGTSSSSGVGSGSAGSGSTDTPAASSTQTLRGNG